MKNRLHFYVDGKNGWIVLMVLCMVLSSLSRIWIVGVKGIGACGSAWWQIVLPVAAALLYAFIGCFNGKEFFFKTAISGWMMAAYSAFWVNSQVPNRVMVIFIWAALVFFAFLYTEMVSGNRFRWVWLLFPMILAALATMLYYNWAAIVSRNRAVMLSLMPDVLALLGAALAVFAIRVHPVGEYHPTWGDRSDGRRIRTLPALNTVSPYIMDNRIGSMNLFEQAFEITAVDRYIRQKRKEGLTNFGIMHVFLAAYCRGVAKYPGINRFISGQKVYSHGEDIQFCLTIKKEMTTESPETEIKAHLSPRDTAKDVYRKVNEAIEAEKNAPLDSAFDKTATVLMMVPGVLLRWVVKLLKLLDYFGLLPPFLLEVSPFHGSVFFTSMGSLGIPPIYHHLYDFGNLPVFGSFGCKRRAYEVLEDGTVVERKYVDFKFSMDERTVDGFYYAAFFKYVKRLIVHPELLDEAPEQIIQDID